MANGTASASAAAAAVVTVKPDPSDAGAEFMREALIQWYVSTRRWKFYNAAAMTEDRRRLAATGGKFDSLDEGDKYLVGFLSENAHKTAELSIKGGIHVTHELRLTQDILDAAVIGMLEQKDDGTKNGTPTWLQVSRLAAEQCQHSVGELMGNPMSAEKLDEAAARLAWHVSVRQFDLYMTMYLSAKTEKETDDNAPIENALYTLAGRTVKEGAEASPVAVRVFLTEVTKKPKVVVLDDDQMEALQQSISRFLDDQVAIHAAAAAKSSAATNTAAAVVVTGTKFSPNKSPPQVLLPPEPPKPGGAARESQSTMSAVASSAQRRVYEVNSAIKTLGSSYNPIRVGEEDDDDDEVLLKSMTRLSMNSVSVKPEYPKTTGAQLKDDEMLMKRMSRLSMDSKRVKLEGAETKTSFNPSVERGVRGEGQRQVIVPLNATAYGYWEFKQTLTGATLQRVSGPMPLRLEVDKYSVHFQYATGAKAGRLRGLYVVMRGGNTIGSIDLDVYVKPPPVHSRWAIDILRKLAVSTSSTWAWTKNDDEYARNVLQTHGMPPWRTVEESLCADPTGYNIVAYARFLWVATVDTMHRTEAAKEAAKKDDPLGRSPIVAQHYNAWAKRALFWLKPLFDAIATDLPQTKGVEEKSVSASRTALEYIHRRIDLSRKLGMDMKAYVSHVTDSAFGVNKSIKTGEHIEGLRPGTMAAILSEFADDSAALTSLVILDAVDEAERATIAFAVLSGNIVDATKNWMAANSASSGFSKIGSYLKEMKKTYGFDAMTATGATESAGSAPGDSVAGVLDKLDDIEKNDHKDPPPPPLEKVTQTPVASSTTPGTSNTNVAQHPAAATPDPPVVSSTVAALGAIVDRNQAGPDTSGSGGVSSEAPQSDEENDQTESGADGSDGVSSGAPQNDKKDGDDASGVSSQNDEEAALIDLAEKAAAAYTEQANAEIEKKAAVDAAATAANTPGVSNAAKNAAKKAAKKATKKAESAKARAAAVEARALKAEEVSIKRRTSTRTAAGAASAANSALYATKRA